MFSRARLFRSFLFWACTVHLSQAQIPIVNPSNYPVRPGLHALVVANETYTHLSRIPVTHSIRDGQSVKSALERVGFKVEFEPDVLNVSRMIEIETRFLATLKPGDKVLFYFTG